MLFLTLSVLNRKVHFSNKYLLTVVATFRLRWPLEATTSLYKLLVTLVLVTSLVFGLHTPRGQKCRIHSYTQRSLFPFQDNTTTKVANVKQDIAFFHCNRAPLSSHRHIHTLSDTGQQEKEKEQSPTTPGPITLADDFDDEELAIGPAMKSTGGIYSSAFSIKRVPS